jgi:membrane-bound lytic murein transglycosylase D
MKFLALILILLAGKMLALAQTNEIDWNAMVDSAQQWAQENLDDDVLNALQTVDRQKVEDFLSHYQDYLKGNYVLDLAQLQTAANAILPVLDAHEETQAYAAWLRARLDYFAAAQEMKEPSTETNAANPSFKTEQEIWIKKTPALPKNAAEFVPKLKPIFAEEGVPPQLVWLAEVESGFDARAKSPAGALGMFQLMPGTAKDFGLSLWPFDQRRQPERAAHAAAKDLRQLHQKFGDWRLAVAAYNCGASRLEKILERNKTKSYEGIATELPAETQMYVPKVEATIFHREGVQLEDLKMPVATADN